MQIFFLQMKLLVIGLFLVCFSDLCFSLSLELNDQWKLYMKIYNKTYGNPFIELTRRGIWENNLKYIQKHNLEHDLGLHTFTMGINQFSDMTYEEFAAIYLSKKLIFQKTGNTYLPPLNAINLPSRVDWREKGYVTGVKSQGACGSCWAFSTTGSLEGQYFRKTQNLVSLSEQQLVDCSKSNSGCDGGLSFRAFMDIKSIGGIESENDYPYKEKESNCVFNRSKVVTSINGIKKIDTNESSLAIAVANEGPIAVSIRASEKFMSYKSGVYNEPNCSKIPNHAVLIVGYGTEGQDNYWIVKNSWSTFWGEKGYVLMSKDKDNQCGIANRAIFPDV